MLSFSKTKMKNPQIPRIEIVFIFFLLIFGIPMLVLAPPGAGYDEEDHLVRVWELSRSSLIPGQLSPQEMQYPTVFRDFAYRQQGSAGVIGAEFWQTYRRASLYEYGTVRREIDTKSVYSPALLFPQALALRFFGRSADMPALLLFYLCRFASLLSYLVLVWMAIRLIPFGKWILMVLALIPMALFQAATVSPDAISNGIGFLFIAGSLKIAEQKEIGWKEVGSLILLVFLLFLAKLNLIPLVLLPFLLITPWRITPRYSYFLLLALTLILFIIEVAGWNLIAAARSNPLLANEADPAAQLLYVIAYPLTFLITIVRDLFANGWTYLQGWINGYGYYYWTPPALISLLFLFSLGAALVVDSSRGQIDRGTRRALVLVFAAGYVATIASLYLTFTPVGSDQIFGVQGRYFVPLALLISLALPGISWTGRKPAPASKWIMLSLSTALALNLLGISLSFHVPCGATFYGTGLCYRPLVKDFPSETRVSPPISGEASLTQEISVACNGLAELRVLVSPSTAEDQGMTRFVLHDPAGSKVLLDTAIANNAISVEDWYPLRFEPDWKSAGKQYRLEILGTDAPTGQGIQVLYTTQPEFDLGALHENGQPVEEDIVVQYGCITGLRKIWLTGKP